VKEEYLRDPEDKEVRLLFHFKICQLQKSHQTLITFSICHAVADGGAIFTLLECIRKIIKGESLDLRDEKLPNFGGLERFKPLDKSFFTPPKVWNEIPNLSVLPDKEDKTGPPYKYASSTFVYDYKPILKFVREHNISIQAMLMALISRATRRFNHLPKETPLWNTTLL